MVLRRLLLLPVAPRPRILETRLLADNSAEQRERMHTKRTTGHDEKRHPRSSADQAIAQRSQHRARGICMGCAEQREDVRPDLIGSARNAPSATKCKVSAPGGAACARNLRDCHFPQHVRLLRTSGTGFMTRLHSTIDVIIGVSYGARGNKQAGVGVCTVTMPNSSADENERRMCSKPATAWSAG